MSWAQLGFLYPSLLAAVILSGIHAWLGVRVVERGAVFAALTLPQVAVFGTALASFAGQDLRSPWTFLWSLVPTLIVAVILARTRPPESIVGIVYAVAASGAVLLMAQAPEGLDHLDDLLGGSLLTVSKHEVAEAAALYAVVGVVLWMFRRKLSDVVLFVLLAIVVTSSVAIAGVLLVFSYLIVPPLLGKRFAVAWIASAIVSAAGVVLSFLTDLPTEATVVCTFGLVLLFAGAWHVVRLRMRRA